MDFPFVEPVPSNYTAGGQALMGDDGGPQSVSHV